MNTSKPEKGEPLFVGLLNKPFKSIILVFLASAIITSVFLVALPAKFRINESSDYAYFYRPVALNLLNGKGLVDNEGGLAVRYPPGYPFILAGLSRFSGTMQIKEETSIILFEIFCMALAAVFIFLISQTFWGPTWALIPALSFSAYPFNLWLAKQPNVELSFMLFFYASIWFLVLALFNKSHRWIFSFMSGVLLGASMLIRPISIGLPFVFGCIIVVNGFKIARNQTWALVGSMILGVTILVVPWESWVYFKTGKIILLSTGGAPSIRDGLTFGVHNPGYRQGLMVPEDIQAVMRYFEAQRQQLGSLGGIVMTTWDIIKEQPLAMAKLFMWKALRCWYGTDSQRYENINILIQLPYIVLFIVTSVKCFLGNRNLRIGVIMIWCIILYFWWMSVLVLPLIRYMLPAIGLLFVIIPVLLKKNHCFNVGDS